MKRVFLIFNRASGRHRNRREEQISGIVSIFHSHGIQVEVCATTHAGSAMDQTRQAADGGFDTVIACGGDGTAHEALNGLMRASTQAVLGVVPLGSGNVLATDLLLPKNPLLAAQALLRYEPRPLRPGVIRYQDKSGPRERYFIVTAGVGLDAELMYRTAVEVKDRYGVNAYFLEMLRMARRGKFPMFQVEWLDEQGIRHREKASLVLAVRTRKFPGLLRRARLGAELARNDFRLMLFQTHQVWRFINYFASVASGWNWKVPKVELAFSTGFRCVADDSGEADAIHCEADGELLGVLPVEVCMGPKSFHLLMPPAPAHGNSVIS